MGTTYPYGIGQTAYALLRGLGKGLAVQDALLQQVLGAARLDSCVGSQIDMWAQDVFGSTFYRFSQFKESDAQFIARIKSILATPKCTQAGMQAILNVFWPWIKLQFSAQLLGMDTTYGGEDASGGEDVASSAVFGATGGFAGTGLAQGLDTYGGEDGTTYEDAPGPGNLPPIPIVFDQLSNPTLAALIAPTIVPPNFCIYVQFPNYSDNLIRPIESPSEILTTLVANWKAVGTNAIFASNR